MYSVPWCKGTNILSSCIIYAPFFRLGMPQVSAEVFICAQIFRMFSAFVRDLRFCPMLIFHFLKKCLERVILLLNFATSKENKENRNFNINI
ncbi:MAG: hypothetical protein IKH63_11575, partial [Prevotella sp.]|nr:hypothetical protein [Prevotella sp.]